MIELEAIENVPYYSLEIPNLSDTPYIIKSEVLNNRTYYFEYFWNNRHQRAYLSIYILSNSEKVYLMRNKSLLPLINLSKYIINDNENWSGSLYFDSTDLGQGYNYNQENISTEYQLRYIP